MRRQTTGERRIYPRHRVRVAVIWRNRDNVPMPGEICDVSAHGLFLVSTSALPDDVGVGDATEISIVCEGQPRLLTGIVRWRGFHPSHQAIGCGIQLDDESAELMATVFPAVLAPPNVSREIALTDAPAGMPPARGARRATS